MNIVLEKLLSSGNNVPDALVDFKSPSCLIRGPSDTGKSYIRDCLWYLLGGDKTPKEIPESKGYDTLSLQIMDDAQNRYTIKRSIFGGEINVYLSRLGEEKSENLVSESLGSMIVRLAGAKNKQILRSKSKRGEVTGGDLRHWSLISQPAMISEESTLGDRTTQTQRKASFHLFLTGQDDSAILLDLSKDDKLKNRVLLDSLKENINRLELQVPKNTSQQEVEESLHKINDQLLYLSEIHVSKVEKLNDVRVSLERNKDSFKKVVSKLNQSEGLVSRLELLDAKYTNDYERLNAIGPAVTILDSIESKPCLLCGSSLNHEVDYQLVNSNALKNYQEAVLAEAEKIEKLRAGLLVALEHERSYRDSLKQEFSALSLELEIIENHERNILEENKDLNITPSLLADRKAECYSQLKLYEEMARLNKQYIDLSEKLPSRRSKPIKRHADSDSKTVGKIILDILHKWGFKDISTISLNPDESDIKIDGRSRLSYGAGKRGIFLSATIVALMQHAICKKYPHLGFVVLDSPIKAYSAPENISDVTISPTVIRDSFYSWLASRQQHGQVIVLENELIDNETSVSLKPIQFSGSSNIGRFGFYPQI